MKYAQEHSLDFLVNYFAEQNGNVRMYSCMCSAFDLVNLSSFAIFLLLQNTCDGEAAVIKNFLDKQFMNPEITCLTPEDLTNLLVAHRLFI